ncbi:glycosyltransferase [Arthrobacter sp. UM1]|uniref:glycosyltransferase n=1 Tax=Arthrobacter sp. UM1 TaxID=2766776 RepID=UPI001CF6DD88|nr:glycosyltransferase [Arthrobacter sp. UM1]MCB4207766.1 glycosyltransferase [Arthrobacter sp. UM1]
MSHPMPRVVHRVVFPADKDVDVLPLYVDQGLPPQPDIEEGWRPSKRKRISVARQTEWHPDDVVSRRSVKVRPNERLSFASYFNAFPAAYWRRWTDVETVALSVRTSGEGMVVVYKSNARGISQRVHSERVSGSRESSWTLPLTAFGDGGWYWFDLIADHEGLVLDSAEYSVDSTAPRGRLSLGTTTFNRADYCVRTIAAIAADEELRESLDEFIVVDQGTQRVRDREEYEGLQSELGPQLKVIEQGNLGGSGGFSRSMSRVLETGADYLLLLDDDILVETEGILRALAFADHCLVPTIVGGHMFDLHARSVLHAWSESAGGYRFDWGITEGLEHRHDFEQDGLRSSPKLHKRWDAGYNGWWMSLIPRAVIEKVGLSLPVFIKWDDAEYSLRAAEAGFPTVTLPGAAVWHVAWIDKDDSIDWQAYFHLRNRLIAALLHSPFDHGGGVLTRCLATDVKHVFSMQWYASAARVDALKDVLSGPGHMHATIGSKAAELRAAKSDFSDADFKPKPADFPQSGRSARRAKRSSPKPPSYAMLPFWLAKTSVRQMFVPPVPEARERPEEVVAKQDATWWRLAALDSALVSNAEGTGISWHKRDPRETRKRLREFAELYSRLYAQWDRLSREYREALPEVTGVPAWTQTFEGNPAARRDGA